MYNEKQANMLRKLAFLEQCTVGCRAEWKSLIHSFTIRAVEIPMYCPPFSEMFNEVRVMSLLESKILRFSFTFFTVYVHPSLDSLKTNQ